MRVAIKLCTVDGEKNYENISIENLSPVHIKVSMELAEFQEAPSLGKNMEIYAGHPCPIAKGLRDAMREFLDF